VFAQAAAFIAVLAIGGLTGHAGKATPGPSSSASTSPVPRISSTRPTPGVSVTSQVNNPAGPSTELTIVMEPASGGGVAIPSVPVDVFRQGFAVPPKPSATSTPGVSGAPTEVATLSVPAGHTYQVCVEQPSGWTFSDSDINTKAIPGWGCKSVDASPPAQLVTFLVAQS
jgi:hypothetical protein